MLCTGGALGISACSELWRPFLLGYPWGWDFSWCQIAGTKEVASSKWGVFEGKYCECDWIICSYLTV